MSRKGQHSQNQAGSGLPSLPSPSADRSASHAQIAALNKRTTQMLRAVDELKDEIFHAPGLADWPHLISRHSTLLSQLYSLTSSLTSQTPNYLSSQLSSLQEFLEMESKNQNMFITQEEDPNPDPVSSYSKLPSLKYSDSKNQLLNLETHPISNSFQDQEKTNILGNVLRSRFDTNVEEEEQVLLKAYQDWYTSRSESEGFDPVSKDENERKRREFDFIKKEKRDHDELVEKALRIWFHRRNEPDENGIGYDFKLRLPKDSDGTEILSGESWEDQGEQQEEGMQDVQMEG